MTCISNIYYILLWNWWIICNYAGTWSALCSYTLTVTLSLYLSDSC